MAKKPYEELSSAGRRYRDIMEAAIAGGYEAPPRTRRTPEEKAEVRKRAQKAYRQSPKGKEQRRRRNVRIREEARAFRAMRSQGRVQLPYYKMSINHIEDAGSAYALASSANEAKRKVEGAIPNIFKVVSNPVSISEQEMFILIDRELESLPNGVWVPVDLMDEDYYHL